MTTLFNNSDSLAQKTEVYWNLSSSYHGKPSEIESLTTEKALITFNWYLDRLGPHRKLHTRFAGLKQSVIEGTPRRRGKSKVVAVDNILYLAAKN